MKPNRQLITITGEDRPGLIASVSGVLAAAGADLEDIEMTRLLGNFAMIVVARGGDEALIADGLQRVALEKDLQIHLQPAVENAAAEEPNVYIAASGPNRVGIVSALSNALAAQKANITDMTTHLVETTAVPVYLVRIEALHEGELGALEDELQRVARQLGIEVRVEPLERADL